MKFLYPYLLAAITILQIPAASASTEEVLAAVLDKTWALQAAQYFNPSSGKMDPYTYERFSQENDLMCNTEWNSPSICNHLAKLKFTSQSSGIANEKYDIKISKRKTRLSDTELLLEIVGEKKSHYEAGILYFRGKKLIMDFCMQYEGTSCNFMERKIFIPSMNE